MGAGASPWRGGAPLVLASTSETRRMLLASAGLRVDTEASGIDERAVEAAAAAEPRAVAARLARAKALAVSRRRPDRVVIGADQTLACDGALFHKPADRGAAREQLVRLSGRTHVLHSAFALVEKGAVVDEGGDEARMTMRSLSGAAIEAYLDLAANGALTGVGAYQVEGVGIHLFARIEGDHSTILGLPLLPLLASLRKMQLLAF